MSVDTVVGSDAVFHMGCHPERSLRAFAFPPLILRRADAQSKDLRFVRIGFNVNGPQVPPLRCERSAPPLGMPIHDRGIFGTTEQAAEKVRRRELCTTARLQSLLRNSREGCFVSGHDFNLVLAAMKSCPVTRLMDLKDMVSL